EHIARKLGSSATSTDLDTLKHDTFFGREKENLVFPIALANLVLHGIDQPNLWHGNSLTRRATYAALFDKAPKQFDVVLTNPPLVARKARTRRRISHLRLAPPRCCLCRTSWPNSRRAARVPWCWTKDYCFVRTRVPS